MRSEILSGKLYADRRNNYKMDNKSENGGWTHVANKVQVISRPGSGVKVSIIELSDEEKRRLSIGDREFPGRDDNTNKPK